jgi:hypothetical protein
MPTFDLSPDEAEIVTRLRESRAASAPMWRPRPLSDFTNEDKAKAFDALYAKTLDWFNEVVQTGYAPRDDDQYIFESLMEMTLGKGVWGPINAAMK